MVGFKIVAPLWFAAVVFAAPPQASQCCLKDNDMNHLIERYTYLLEYPLGNDFNTTAEAILSDKFYVKSDSILTLSSQPLGGFAYPSKDAFIMGQAQTPAMPNIETLGKFHDCKNIAWRWKTASVGPNPIQGIITMSVDPEKMQIDAVYSEFNSGAWQENIANSTSASGQQ